MAGDDDETLTEQFWGVARQLRHLSLETLAPWDLNPSHARALRVLVHHGALRLGDLSVQLRIAARSATEVVDALEQRGLVERRPDPDDRRATLVALTDEGARVSRSIRSARKAEAARLFGELSRADQAHLARILRKLSASDRP